MQPHSLKESRPQSTLASSHSPLFATLLGVEYYTFFPFQLDETITILFDLMNKSSGRTNYYMKLL